MFRKRSLWLMLMVLALVFALAACGGQAQEAPAAAEPAQQEEAAPAQEEAPKAEETEAAQAEETEEAKAEETEEAAEEGGAQDLVAMGQELFNQNPLGSNAGCVTCHSVEPGVQLVGPSLAGIATTAAERVPGMSAEDYIRQSITDPTAYTVEGFPEGLMPTYSDLTPEQIDALVAYLMTLK